jgi:isocitrate dehydrogenase
LFRFQSVGHAISQPTCKPTIVTFTLYIFQYKATDFVVPASGKLELVYKPADGGEAVIYEVHTFKNGGGVAMGMYNTDEVGTLVHFFFLCFCVPSS